MRNLLLLCVLWMIDPGIKAAAPQVPAKYEFAGIELIIRDGARKDIQKDVDAIHRNRSYFDKRLETVDLYFPIIERVFREEGLPDDFKYLVIQESALIPDAVSSSNAVGYWQFKIATAVEMGLRVDRHIDERMNIVSSTRAAAKYLKQHNFYFDNWLYALLAYQAGRGGAEKHVDIKFRGAKKMEINQGTYWYVKKFLAHKVAYENEVGKNKSPDYAFYEYTKGANLSLEEIAQQFDADADMVLSYNKWLRRGKIPSDKDYTVLVPLPPDQINQMNAIAKVEFREEEPKIKKSGIGSVLTKSGISTNDYNFSESNHYPIIKESNGAGEFKINGIPGYVAQPGDTPANIAKLMDVPLNKFLKYNDLTSGDRIEEGQVYYLKKKRGKAKIHYHITKPGETLWDISQKYGLRLKKLLTKNRMKTEIESEAGRVLWLRYIRPSDVPIEYKPVSKPQRTEDMIAEQKKEVIKPQTSTNANTSVLESAPFFEQREEEVKQEASSATYIDEKSFLNLEEEPVEESTTKSATTPVSTEDQKTETRYHTVASGETLYSISKKYEISMSDLLELNDIKMTDTLKIDQTLIIQKEVRNPVQDEQQWAEGQIILHKVKSDETLYGIARKYGVTIKQIMEWNNKDDFNLHIGEELKVRLNE